jgi:hypothetical protein
MKTLLIYPILCYVLTASTIPKHKPYGEIIINTIPAWKPVTASATWIVEITVPELTSEFLARNKITVAVRFRNQEDFKLLPYFDNQSVSPGNYDYNLSPLKLTCTFSPKAKGGSNGSAIMPMLQISLNFTNITFE